MNNYDDFETQIYYDRAPAEAAVERLHRLGYRQDEIGVIMDDRTREKAFAAVVNAKGSEGLATGGVIGGILGAIVAGVTATGSVAAIAGTGGLATPLVAGPLVAALAGLGAGATGGGIIGGLIGLGVGESHAKQYEKGLREGGILVAVRPKQDVDRDAVRRAMSSEAQQRAMTGEIDRSVDYAGEYDPERTT
jgi:hypothetical protein